MLGAFARLPHAVSVRAWTGMLAVAYAILVLASLALGGARRIIALLAAFVFGLASGAGTSDVALGQIALVSAAGIALALAALERPSVGTAALGTLLAGAQPNLALALIARMRDRVASASAAAGALLFTALTLVAGGGVPGFTAYLRRLGEHGRAERFSMIQHTPAAIAWAFGASEPVSTAIGAACALGAIAAVAIVTVRARLTPLAGTLLATAALPLAVPFFHEHDFVVELIPLIVLGVGARGSARALAGGAAALIGIDWLGLAQHPAAAAQIIAEGAAVACTFVALGRGERVGRADLVPFLVTLGLALACVPLGRAHPAAVWPDRLPPGYRAAPDADASAVWAGEQRAAGLDARSPATGVLRILPLAGCAVLGGALVLQARRRVAAPLAA